MALADVRAGVLAVLQTLDGVTVPDDPLPERLEDKTVLCWPEPGDSTPGLHRAKTGGIVVECRDQIVIEYHRVIPAKQFGSVIGDVTEKLDSIRALAWAEMTPAGGKFNGTVALLHSINRRKFGELGWNEFTFGVRLALELTHYAAIS